MFAHWTEHFQSLWGQLSKNPGAFAQSTNSSANAIVQTYGAITDTHTFTTTDQSRLTAMIQQQQVDECDDMEMRALAAKRTLARLVPM